MSSLRSLGLVCLVLASVSEAAAESQPSPGSESKQVAR